MSKIKESDIRDFFYNASTSYGFIHAEKELTIEGLRIDIFAIDSKHNPCIIEFKTSKNRHIVGQAAQYLAIVPSYHKEISKKIKFHTINWENLSIVLIAPDFYDRDLTAANYAPLQNKVHFYTYKTIQNSREKVFGLQIKYVGPIESGPIILPKEIIDSSDLIDMYKHICHLEKRESRREYYTNHVQPVFRSIESMVSEFFSAQNLFFHTTYFENNPPYYMIRIGTDKKHTHRASICIAFYSESVDFGFDLTHSIEEGKLLSEIFQDDQICEHIAKEIKKKDKHSLYIPSTGFNIFLPINWITLDALKAVLKRYSPVKLRDCYFRITKSYTEKSLSAEEVTNILVKEYEEFKFIFDLLAKAKQSHTPAASQRPLSEREDK
ncbi:MAG: hypothetical protein HGB19_07225 [Chlorobiales bacterium]|jgi:hypothetical protein|nr:hypothetical protein [Chlorobiales bacterium]